MEGYTDPHDGDVILNVEMFVPSSHVGRIIGKGGANVRELQRLTGAMIKLPDQLSPPPKDQTSVVLIGKWIQVLVSSNLNFGFKISGKNDPKLTISFYRLLSNDYVQCFCKLLIPMVPLQPFLNE